MLLSDIFLFFLYLTLGCSSCWLWREPSERSDNQVCEGLYKQSQMPNILHFCKCVLPIHTTSLVPTPSHPSVCRVQY